MREEKSKSNQLNRTERLRLKVYICILGILLLLLLFLGRMSKRPGEQGEEPHLPLHTPTVHVLHNVWIVETGEENMLLYRDGAEESYFYGVVEQDGELHLYQPEWGIREQVADIELTDGMVTDVRLKTEKIRGVVLSADEEAIEVEGYGRLQLSADFRGYRIFNTLAMCTQRDLAFGYDFTDIVLDKGEVCAVLMVREEAMDYIRVLVKTSDYEANLHQELALTSDARFVIRYGTYDAPAEEWHEAGEKVVIDRGSAYFAGGRISVEPAVLTGKISLLNVGRSQGVPAYRGHLELITEKGGFAVVNVLSLEEYLYSVVPSEMPASYPREALKAQAVCARTYAYGHIEHAAYPAYGAHVDDSTSYQVYNNIAEQESTTTAVKETYGQLLYTEEGELAETYYYSTSCGVGSDANVWKTDAAGEITYLKAEAVNPNKKRAEGGIEIGEYLRDEEHFAAFITASDPEDFEAGEGWYRWSYRVKRIDPDRICNILKERYQANDQLVLTLKKEEYVSQKIKTFTKITEMYVASRLSGGAADELVIETDAGVYKVISEYNIRCVLCDGETKVKRQNGSEVAMPKLLPSGFFIMETGKEKGNVVGYTLTGGGFGHGVGMSQNAAKSMAGNGMSGEEILLFFYKGCTLRRIYSA